jgi:hypothetical protein
VSRTAKGSWVAVPPSSRQRFNMVLSGATLNAINDDIDRVEKANKKPRLSMSAWVRLAIAKALKS